MTWQDTGKMLRSSVKRRAMSRLGEGKERCEGCGVEVSRGTLRNVLVNADAIAGTDHRTSRPYHAFEAFKALCARCERGA